MTNLSKQIDSKMLKTLNPLSQLSAFILDEIAAKSIIDEVPADRIICRRGEKDSRQIYLLAGSVEVINLETITKEVIKSKSPVKIPIAEGSPRTATLKTKTASTLLYIDADLLELLKSEKTESLSNYEVTEIDGDDWMLSFLQSPAFLQLPTENLQKLLTNMEEVQVKKDQVIMKQGGKDDNYFIIKSGSCNVHCKTDTDNELITVLHNGSGFGEEALITNGSRNATITMRENGTLMKLRKEDFLEHLVTPIVDYFDQTETQKKLNNSSVIIDVRPEQQSKQQPFNDAINIPLGILRSKLDSLDTDREYLIVCNDGSQSTAAAFLMIQKGINCSVLKNGIKASDVKKLSKKIADKQKQIDTTRIKTEQDRLRQQKELSQSQAKIFQNKQQVSIAHNEATQMKEKASQELAQAQAESKTIELHKNEIKKTMRRAKEMIEQSTAAAELSRKKAEEEAASIKQRAMEEANQLRTNIETERKIIEQDAIRLKQKEDVINNSALQIKNKAASVKQHTIDEVEQLRANIETERKKIEQDAIRLKQKEAIINNSALQIKNEAASIKQQAIQEADNIRANVETERKKIEQDAIRLKQKEAVINNSALQLKNEAEKIRREAMSDAQKIRAEIETTHTLLNEKLEHIKNDEKNKHETIIAETKKRADELAEIKTERAKLEAEAIRQKAKKDAARLHNELKQTRNKIKAEAAQIIIELKKQSKHVKSKKVKPAKDEITADLTSSQINRIAEENLNFKSVSIPGISSVKSNDQNFAKTKTAKPKPETYKTRDNNFEDESDLFSLNKPYIDNGADDSFIEQPYSTTKKLTEPGLTEIMTESQEIELGRIRQEKEEHEDSLKNNVFLNKTSSASTTESNYGQPQNNLASNYNGSKSTKNLNNQLYQKQHKHTKSNTFAIAFSFLIILAGAIFTLDATNTLKVQTIASLFNSGNDTVKKRTVHTAKNKSTRKKVLRADVKVSVKKKIENKMDSLMQDWKDMLSDSNDQEK